MKKVLLKNILEEDWAWFKSEAAIHDMKMAEFFSYIVREHTKKGHAKERWTRILSWRSGRSKTELNKLETTLNKLRHSFRLER